MKTIHKYPISLKNEFEIEMPEGAKVLDVQWTVGVGWQMWALVDTELPMVKRKFKAYWTGDDLTSADFSSTYIATIQDTFVWHIFE